MQQLLDIVLKHIDVQRLMANTGKLHQCELGQTFDDYRRAAECAVGLAREAGLTDCKIIDFPADGTTVFQDKRMPLAWRASRGSLTIVQSSVPFNDPVVADYQRHPFHLVKGSVATPPDGLLVRIITENQLLTGADAENCLVLTNPETRPQSNILKAALDLGALGLVADNLCGRYQTPDGIQWVTACTDAFNNPWHVQSEDRPFICFSVSPRIGAQIRAAVWAGTVQARVQSDGERYIGKLPAVTALLPGRQPRELWMLAHLYEPLADDNSAGVAASVEIARVIKELVQKGELPPLEFSLRLVFAMELYGFAAFAEQMGSDLRDRVVGAINNDGLPITAKTSMNIYLAPPGTPFFGNYLMEILVGNYPCTVEPPVHSLIAEGMYGDDTSLSDPTVGLPTLWVLHHGAMLWHNSAQTMEMVQPERFANVTALIGAWTAAVLTLNQADLSGVLARAAALSRDRLREEARRIGEALPRNEFRRGTDIAAEIRARMLYRLKVESAQIADFRKVADLLEISDHAAGLESEAQSLITALEKQAATLNPLSGHTLPDKWLEYAASIVPARATRGLPHDLVAVPKNERTGLGIIYGPLARILAGMDGRRDLRTLIREVEWELNKKFQPREIKKHVTAVAYLSDHGYLKTEFHARICKADIVRALRQLGVQDGDLLFIHSSLSACGCIEGGAEAILDALTEAVGKDGTVLFPTFTHTMIYFEGRHVKRLAYRPFDIADPAQVWTGQVPQAAMRRPGVRRSVHPTHSNVGLGPLAEACLREHQETDPPTCRRSPMGKLLEFKGKILYFGTGLAPTTFLHFIEDELDLPYLANAVCRVKRPHGRVQTMLIPKHLPGDRDFYTPRAETCKFFKQVLADGLVIGETTLGLGSLQLINAAQLYDLGMRAARAAPDIFLCDKTECSFCSTYRRMPEQTGKTS